MLASRVSIYLCAIPFILLLIFRKSRWVSILAGVALGTAVATIHLQALSRSELRAAIGEEVTVSGVVSSDPKQLSSRVIGSRLISGQSTFTIRVEELQAKSEIHSMRIPIRVI